MTKNQTEPVKKYPKVILPMSGSRRGVVTLSEYKKKLYLMFREQYQDPEGEFVFGKGGFNVPMASLTAKHCEKLSAFFDKLGEKLSDQESDDDE